MVSSVIRKPVSLEGEGRNVPKGYLKNPTPCVVNLQPLSVCWAFSCVSVVVCTILADKGVYYCVMSEK